MDNQAAVGGRQPGARRCYEVTQRSPMAVIPASATANQRSVPAAGKVPLSTTAPCLHGEPASSVVFRSFDDLEDWEWESPRLRLRAVLSAGTDSFDKPAIISEMRRNPETQIAVSGSTIYVVRSPDRTGQNQPAQGFEYLKYEIPHFSASANVHIHSFPPNYVDLVTETEVADDSFEIGWITACNYSDIKCSYEYGEERGFVLIRPAQLHRNDDAVSDSKISDNQQLPWANAEAVGRFNRARSHGAVHLNDVAYRSPEIPFRHNDGKLARVRHNQGYTTWLVAHNTRLDCHCKDLPYKVLLAYKWTCDLEIAIDADQPLGKRAIVVGRSTQGIHKISMVRYLRPLPAAVILRPYTLDSLQAPHWVRSEELVVPRELRRQWHRNHSWVLKKSQSKEDGHVYMYTNAENSDSFLYTVDKVTEFVQRHVKCHLVDGGTVPALTASADPFVEFHVELTVANDWSSYTEWEIGWIQACSYLSVTALYEGGDVRREYLHDTLGEMLRDSKLQFSSGVWYDLASKFVLRARGHGMTQILLTHRSPLAASYALVNAADTETRHHLTEVLDDAGFYTWLVARNVKTGDFLVLLTFRWSRHVAVRIKPNFGIIQDGTVQQQPEVFYGEAVPIPACVLYGPSTLERGTATFYDSPRCRSSRARQGADMLPSLTETSQSGAAAGTGATSARVAAAAAGPSPPRRRSDVIFVHQNQNVSLSHSDVDERTDSRNAPSPRRQMTPVAAAAIATADARAATAAGTQTLSPRSTLSSQTTSPTARAERSLPPPYYAPFYSATSPWFPHAQRSSNDTPMPSNPTSTTSPLPPHGSRRSVKVAPMRFGARQREVINIHENDAQRGNPPALPLTSPPRAATSPLRTRPPPQQQQQQQQQQPRLRSPDIRETGCDSRADVVPRVTGGSAHHSEGVMVHEADRITLGYLPVVGLGDGLVAPIGEMITTTLSPVLRARLQFLRRSIGGASCL